MQSNNKRKHSNTHNFGRTQIKRADGFPFPGFRQVERKPKRGLHECKHLYISRNVNRKQVLVRDQKKKKQTSETDKNVQGTCDMLPLVNCVRGFEDKKAL